MVEWIKVGGSGRLTDLVGLGALTSLVPRQVLDEAIELRSGQKDRLRENARLGRDLDPHQAVIVRVVDYTVGPWPPDLHRRHRTYPRSVKRTRRSSYRERHPSDKGLHHAGPPTVQLLSATRATKPK